MGGLWLAQGSLRGPGASGQGLAEAFLDLRGKLGRQCWGHRDREFLRVIGLLPDVPWPRTESLLTGCACRVGPVAVPEAGWWGGQD